jgi:hypothetical protein
MPIICGSCWPPRLPALAAGSPDRAVLWPFGRDLAFPLLGLLRGNDLLLGLLRKPLGGGKVRVVLRVDVLHWLLGKGDATTEQRCAEQRLGEMLAHSLSLKFEGKKYSTVSAGSAENMRDSAE